MEKSILFTKYIERIEHGKDLSSAKKLKAYYRLLQLILEDLSDEEKINFTSFFSRIAYVGARQKLEGRFLYLLHTMRRAVENEKIDADNEEDFLLLAKFCCIDLLNRCYSTTLTTSVNAKSIYQKFRSTSDDLLGFSSIMRGLINGWDKEKKLIYFIDESEGVKELNVRYDVAHKNEIFTTSIERLCEHIPFPIHVNLVDVELLKDDILVPKAFVIEPDYMIDVTGIANTFKYYGTEPLEVLINKFRPMDMSIHLLLGNIANYLLDEIVNQEEVTYEDIIHKIFLLSPLQFACLDDKAVVQVLKLGRMHFNHLKHVVNVEFRKESIATSDIYLEPSFYSRDYGVQGRLDLLHEDRHDHHFDIVELKSGSPFMPNNYGLSVQHYTQTLLYDLIIKSVYKGRKKTSNYILYSKEEEWQLRNAPVLKVQQYEALKTRNDLLLIEYLLSQVSTGDDGSNILRGIKPASFPKAKGFLKNHVQEFYDLFKGLSEVEQAYMTVLTRFIAREHRLAKVGEHGLSKANGLAALWLEESSEKEDRFSILHSLKIADNQSSSDVPVVTLSRTANSPELSRFREGDIVVLYPQSGSKSVLHNQIFKCNIIGINDEALTLKLRSRQYNQRIFNDNELWAIEGDVMDSSFLSMYRSLYTWARAEQRIKSLTLGLEPPEKSAGLYEYHSDEMTEEQNLLLNHVIHTRDYYLLWGPPGTGKTSVMIKHLVRYLFHYTQERIVLVAYTNRAVDEICEAIIHALEDVSEPFIRIGSSHSCGPAYREYLLDQQAEKLTSRKEILDLLKGHRVIVSTVSSIINRVEIFHLYEFDTIIIDEASQILEPMIIGLLAKFKRFIMIGDHKQLPAVVVQPQSDTAIKDEILREIGFANTGTSLFERLYSRCVQEDWSHAYGILSQQGRMHRDLMSYPNTYFYENKLEVIKGIDRLQDVKEMPMPNGADINLWRSRMTYIPTPIEEDFSWKTNTLEAEEVIRIIKELRTVYAFNGLEWGASTCGVITPYRAQIAMIRKKMLDELDKEFMDTITVDTVERYQGGARDIIIISLCTNRLDQMERLVSLSEDGIDRKLNVALTRARERIFILGNEEVLQNDANYSRLIDLAYTVSSGS